MIKYKHLEGRTYEWGKQDCFSIVQDFYRDNFDLQIRDYARPADFWETGIDMWGNHFRDEGFELVDGPVQIADGFLIAMSDQPFATHAAIFVGDNKILHHYTGQRSVAEPYKGIWRNRTVATVRHRSIKLNSLVLPKADLLDLLPPARREAILAARSK